MAFGFGKKNTQTEDSVAGLDLDAIAHRVENGEFPNVLSLYMVEQAFSHGGALVTQGYVVDGVTTQEGFAKTLEGALLLRIVGEGLIELAGQIAGDLQGSRPGV